MGLKKQLKLVNAFKEMSTGGGAAGINSNRQQAQSFRRSKSFAQKFRYEEEENLREEIAATNELERWMKCNNLPLTPLGLHCGSEASSSPPTLFIDGYNVVGQYPRLRDLRDLGDLESARDELTAAVRRYSGTAKVDPVIVWDGRGAPGRSAQVQSDRKTGISVVYTADADMWVENKVFEMIREGNATEFESVLCVTADVLFAQMVFGLGALVISSRVFIDELQACDMIPKVKRFSTDVRPPGEQQWRNNNNNNTLNNSRGDDLLSLRKKLASRNVSEKERKIAEQMRRFRSSPSHLEKNGNSP